MTRIARKGVTIALLVILLVGIVLWSLYIPRNPRLLFRCLPGNAALVSVHFNLAERWWDLSKNPFAMSVVQAVGAEPEDLASLQYNPERQLLMDWLASDELVMAYVPEVGLFGDDAWFFAAWIGGRSQVFRWADSQAERAGLASVESDSGWPVWIMSEPVDEEGRRLSVSIADGVIIGAVSKNGRAVEEALAGFNGLMPSLANRGDLETLIQRTLHSPYPDRGWFRHGLLPGKQFVDELFYEFDLAKPDFFEGRLVWPVGYAVQKTSSEDAQQSFLSLVETRPIGYGTVSGTLAGHWLEGGMKRILDDTSEGWQGRGVAASILPDEYSGRFKGIKIPTLLVGLEVPSSVETGPLVNRLLDALNAQYQLGLVPIPLSLYDRDVYAVEGTGDNLYGVLSRSEQVAMTRYGDWLIVGSNLGGLKKVLAGANEDSAGHWEPKAGMTEADAALWLDLDRVGGAVQLGLTHYSTKLLFENARGTRDKRQRINVAKAWLDALIPLQEFLVRVTAGTDETILHFTAGQLTGGD